MILLLLAVNLSMVKSGGDDNCEADEPGTLYANPKDIKMYYECSGGKLYEKQCSVGLVFNAELHVCEYPQ